MRSHSRSRPTPTPPDSRCALPDVDLPPRAEQGSASSEQMERSARWSDDRAALPQSGSREAMRRLERYPQVLADEAE
ncbi:MAG: hypothetical protein QOE61_781 [Micromonosporaceae bacterium]|nr:hypothetical protein [Micromonosporaceae bacterium]